MANVRHILSLDLPELAPYRTLRRPQEHLRDGIFVAEGEKVVRRLLAADLNVHSLLVTPEWLDRLLVGKHLQGREGTTIFVAEKRLLESIVGFSLHQGIMAVGETPRERSLAELIRDAMQPRLLVALDGLVNAENVGIVVRNCAAFGVQALIAGESSSSPYLRRAVRNSMGAVFTLPILHTPDLRQTLRVLRNENAFAIFGTHPHAGQTIVEVDFSGDTLLILGNEGDGISPGILNECTGQVAIPMMNGTDSLNVASASAVFLYEVRRQRSRPAPVAAPGGADSITKPR